MLPDKETTNTDEDLSEDQPEPELHNASAESDPLDSEQKAASEADTLPIEKKVEGLEVAKSERCVLNIMPPRETLENLLYFMHKKTYAVFFVFHLKQLYIFA